MAMQAMQQGWSYSGGVLIFKLNRQNWDSQVSCSLIIFIIVVSPNRRVQCIQPLYQLSLPFVIFRIPTTKLVMTFKFTKKKKKEVNKKFIYLVPCGRIPSPVLILAPISLRSSTLWMPKAWKTPKAAEAVTSMMREVTPKALTGMRQESPTPPLWYENTEITQKYEEKKKMCRAFVWEKTRNTETEIELYPTTTLINPLFLIDKNLKISY